MEVIILVITNIISPIITSYVTWAQAKKKYYSEVDSNEINNMKQCLEFYKALSDDNKNRLNEMIQSNAQLQREMADLKSQMLQLTMNICMDMTCKKRVLSDQIQNNRYKE